MGQAQSCVRPNAIATPKMYRDDDNVEDQGADAATWCPPHELPDFSMKSDRSAKAMQWLEEQSERQQQKNKQAKRIAQKACAANDTIQAIHNPSYDANAVITEVVRKLSDPKLKRKASPDRQDSLRQAVETWLSRVAASSEIETRRHVLSTPPDSDRVSSEAKRVRSLAKYLLVEEPEKAYVALAAAAAATQSTNTHLAPLPESETPSATSLTSSAAAAAAAALNAASTSSGKVTTPDEIAGSDHHHDVVVAKEDAENKISDDNNNSNNKDAGGGGDCEEKEEDDDDDGSEITLEDVPAVVVDEARKRRAVQWRAATTAVVASNRIIKPSLAHLRKTPRKDRVSTGDISPSRWGRVRIALGFTPRSPDGSNAKPSSSVRRTKTPADSLIPVGHTPDMECDARTSCSRSSSRSGASRKATPWVTPPVSESCKTEFSRTCSRSSSRSGASRKATPWVGTSSN